MDNLRSSVRRIITRGVIDMATSAVLESEGYDYAGPMALCDEGELAIITRTIGEIGAAAKASGVKVEKQLGDLTEHTRKQDARILDLEQKLVAKGTGGGAGGGNLRLRLGQTIASNPAIEQVRKGEI